MNKEEALQVFDGVMLSDGGIYVSRRSCCFRLVLSGIEHMDWLNHVKEALKLLGVEFNPGTPNSHKRVGYTGKVLDYCQLGSKVSALVTHQRARWYPNGRKEVPEDFLFTPISLANEVMGDGSSNWNSSNPDYGVFMELCTESFSLASIGRIEHQLRLLGLTNLSRVHLPARQGSEIGIVVRGLSAGLLMSTVEPHILPSYRYKIKKPGMKARVNPLQQAATSLYNKEHT